MNKKTIAQQIKSDFQNELENQMKHAEKILDNIKSLISNEENKTAIFMCSYCGNKHKASDIDLSEENIYVEPYSCNGGDYYKFVGYKFNCSACGMYQQVVHNESKFLDKKFLNSFGSGLD